MIDGELPSHVGSGNPLIKREMDLQGKIKDLKMEKSRYSEKIYELQRERIIAEMETALKAVEGYANAEEEKVRIRKTTSREKERTRKEKSTRRS